MVKKNKHRWKSARLNFGAAYGEVMVDVGRSRASTNTESWDHDRWLLRILHPSSMADLDEFERAASAFPDLDDIGPATTAPTGRTSFPALDGSDGVDDFGGFDDDSGFGALSGGNSFSANQAPNVKVTGDDVLEKFEDQFPDLGEVRRHPQPKDVSLY